MMTHHLNGDMVKERKGIWNTWKGIFKRDKIKDCITGRKLMSEGSVLYRIWTGTDCLTLVSYKRIIILLIRS